MIFHLYKYLLFCINADVCFSRVLILPGLKLCMLIVIPNIYWAPAITRPHAKWLECSFSFNPIHSSMPFLWMIGLRLSGCNICSRSWDLVSHGVGLQLRSTWHRMKVLPTKWYVTEHGSFFCESYHMDASEHGGGWSQKKHRLEKWVETLWRHVLVPQIIIK